MKLIDKKVKTTATIIFLMIKSVEENINTLREMKVKKTQLKLPKVKNEISPVENALVEVTAHWKLKKKRSVNLKNSNRKYPGKERKMTYLKI